MLKTLFYDNRPLLILSLIIILVGGASALLGLPRLEDPRINNRNPVIVTLLPGASAERVEALVTKKLEEELREVSEIKEIESDSRANVSLITIELKDDVYNTEEVFTRLRNKLADAESELPREASKPDFDDERGAVAYTYILGVTWNAESEPVMGIIGRTAEELADRLRNLGGTDLVRVYGEPAEEISITVDRDAAAQLGLSTAEIRNRIAAADAKLPAGKLRSSDSNLVIEVAGGFELIDRIGNIPLRAGVQSDVVRLSDVATIEQKWLDPPTEIGIVEGKRAVYVAARMLDAQRGDLWMNDARRVVEDFRAELSPIVGIVEAFDQGRYTDVRLAELGMNLVMGACVVTLVIFFMMGWRSSLLVGSSLPLVSAMALFAMLVIGMPLHQMSIFGLIVALGLLIDNAIVTVDEIGTELRNGHSAREAIAGTVTHLFVPLLGSTLTTVLAFLPIFLLPGSVGEFVGPIATTVILALLFSLFVSMTIIPAMTGAFQRFGKSDAWWQRGMQTPRLARWLRGSIAFGTRHAYVGLAFAMLLPAIGFLRVGELRNQFFPAADRDQFHVQVWMPPEASLNQTAEMARQMSDEMKRHEGIVAVNWLVGNSIPTVYYNMIMDQDEKPSYAQAVVTTDTRDRAKRLIGELQASLDKKFPQAQTVVKSLGQGPPVDAPVEIRVFGSNVDQLRKIAEDLQLALYEMPEVIHTRTLIGTSAPKLWVDVDEVETRLAGLTLADVSAQLQSNLEGITGGSILEGTEELPVRVRFDNSLRDDLTDVASSRILLPGQTDEFFDDSVAWTPLSALGELKLRPQTPSIHRRNGERSNTIKAYLTPDALAPEVTAKLVRRLAADDVELPPGYRMELGGDAEELRSATGNLLRYAPVLGMLMMATIVLSFRSFLLAGILGGVAALSAGLGLVNLWFADFPLGFNPLIGMAGLIGIALNDSIVVLAQIRTSDAARAGDIEAIVDEVMKTSRHVLSTTLTTIGGFLPLLMSGGDFWPPLAIVIAGGVGGASLLALYFVPAAYVTVRRFVERHPAAGSIDSLAMPSSSYHLRIGRQILSEPV